MRNEGCEKRLHRWADDSLSGCHLILATRMSTRLRGLLFSAPSNAVILLAPCHDIHTFGMRYAIDTAFVDDTGLVLRAERDVLPNRRLRAKKAVAVLERYAIPREAWFEEGGRLAIGAFQRSEVIAAVSEGGG